MPGVSSNPSDDPSPFHHAQLGRSIGGAFPLGQRLDGLLGYAFLFCRLFLPARPFRTRNTRAGAGRTHPGDGHHGAILRRSTNPFASLGYRHRRVRGRASTKLEQPTTLFRVLQTGVFYLLWDNVGFGVSCTGQEGRRLTLDVEHALLGKRSSAVRTTLTGPGPNTCHPSTASMASR